jgi:hypothetical protein
MYNYIYIYNNMYSCIYIMDGLGAYGMCLGLFDMQILHIPMSIAKRARTRERERRGRASNWNGVAVRDRHRHRQKDRDERGGGGYI